MSMSIAELHHHLTKCNISSDEIYRELNELYKRAKNEGIEQGRREKEKEINDSGFYLAPNQWGTLSR